MEILKDIDEEERFIVKKEKVKVFGYIGFFILYRLYLYGFLYDKDLVFDEMYEIFLNVVKYYL